MASIRKETLIEARPEDVWAALGDFGAVHERLAPGFVVNCDLVGDTRRVTFFNGAVARERLVDRDDDARRLVYSVVESQLGFTHHNASAQVHADGDDGSRFVWIADLLPDSLGETVDALMERGIGVMKDALESQTAPD